MLPAIRFTLHTANHHQLMTVDSDFNYGIEAKSTLPAGRHQTELCILQQCTNTESAMLLIYCLQFVSVKKKFYTSESKLQTLLQRCCMHAE